MEKINYQVKMEEEINKLNTIKKLLLHSCCAPCSSYVLSYLTKYFDITVLYYNPNIEPIEEYEKRKQEEIRLIKELPKVNKIDIIDCDWDNDLFHEKVKGLEHLPEKSERCYICYAMRLLKTVQLAKENHYDYFATTLTVSPYKDCIKINEIGYNLEKKYGIKYLCSDFKKKNGYKQSIELSHKYNLYRQNYCGCIYSKEQSYKIVKKN